MTLGGLRPTTWETLLCAWETFTGVRSGKTARAWRLVVWGLLALEIAFAAASYSQLTELREPGDLIPSPTPATLDTDKTRLLTLRDGLRMAMQQRANSGLWVQIMRERGRDLFAGLPSLQLAVPELSGLEVSPPPEIVVKAVMKFEDSWSVVADIAGAGSGLVLHPGDSFMEGRGKVVRMEGNRLIVRWDGREWTAVPGLF